MQRLGGVLIAIFGGFLAVAGWFWIVLGIYIAASEPYSDDLGRHPGLPEGVLLVIGGIAFVACGRGLKGVARWIIIRRNQRRAARLRARYG